MSRWSYCVGLAAAVCGLSLAAGCAGPGHSPLAKLFAKFPNPLGVSADNPLRRQLDETNRRREAQQLADSTGPADSGAMHTASRTADYAGTGAGGHDPATQALIDQELRDATPEERAQLAADLRGLDPAVVRNILKVRRVARQVGRQPGSAAEPGHSHMRQVGHAADATGTGFEDAGGTASGAPIITPRDPYAHVPGRMPSTDPGLGAADPWGRAAAFPADPAAVTSLPPAPHHSPHPAPLHDTSYADAGPRNPVELSPETFTAEPPGPRRPFIQRPLAAGQPDGFSPDGVQAGFRGAPGNQYASEYASQYGRLPGEPYPPAPPASDYTAPGGDPFARPPVHIASSDPNQQIPGALAGADPSGFAGDPQSMQHAQSTKNLDWSGDLLQVITRMEASLGQTRYADLETDEEKTRFIERHVFLRMLYLMVGREERALAAIPDVPAADREFWQQVFWGMSSYFDSAIMPEEDYRAAQAVAQLRAAVQRLQQKAQLELRNVAFCHKVSNFGSYERFERDEFRPGQPVLLYAELVNFTSEMNADGLYHTRLKSTVEISRPGPDGEVVERLSFPATEDLCHSYRRDYFHSYEFAIPPRLALGPHVLTLIVEDELSHKIATYRLNFTVN